MELGGCKPRGLQRGAAGRVRRGPAPRGGNHTSSDVRTHTPPTLLTRPEDYDRSGPKWSVGSCLHRDVRGSYVGTDAAPGQSGPFAIFSPEDACHRDPEAPHGEQALDTAGLCLSHFISFTYLCTSHLGTIWSVQNQRFLKGNVSVHKWKENSARNVPTVVPDITSMNWGPRDQPKIWGQASVGEEDSRSGLLSGSPGRTGVKLCEAGNPVCLI